MKLGVFPSLNFAWHAFILNTLCTDWSDCQIVPYLCSTRLLQTQCRNIQNMLGSWTLLTSWTWRRQLRRDCMSFLISFSMFLLTKVSIKSAASCCTLIHLAAFRQEPNLYEDEFTYHQIPIEEHLHLQMGLDMSSNLQDSRREDLLDALEPASFGCKNMQCLRVQSFSVLSYVVSSTLVMRGQRVTWSITV